MKWSNVRLIFLREARDQLRDRRMIFMIAVLPLVLYPLLGLNWIQVSQFMQERPSRILLIGEDSLPEQPALIEEDDSSTPPVKQLSESFCSEADARLLLVEFQTGDSQPSEERAT
jgi:sodium transport system permease protein